MKSCGYDRKVNTPASSWYLKNAGITETVRFPRSNEVYNISWSSGIVADIRLQLNEQLRCLDVRMETQVAVVAELQDFFRKRAEVELDYSKNLDKLAKNLQLRHKEQKQK